MAELARKFTRDGLRELLDQRIGPLVSILMPVVHTGSDNRENRSRLNNLMRRAEEMIRALDIGSPEIRAMFVPVRDNMGDDVNYQGNGLAIFLSVAPDILRVYKTETPITEEQVIVGDRFFVKPLLAELTQQRFHYYLLTLSQRQVRLLEGDHDELHEIEIPNLPTNMDDTLMLEHDGYSEGRKAVGQSGRPDAPGTQSGTGGMTTSFAGHGAGDGVQPKGYILEYFRKIEQAISPYLSDKSSPLILVGTEEMQSLFKQVTDYKHVLDKGIYGNPTGFTARDLLERGETLVRPMLDRAKQDALERYPEYLAKKLASNKVLDVLKAAYMGQIDTLFVPLETELWGVFDFNTEKLEVHIEQKVGDVDLIDLAASQTLANAGQVFVVPQEEMPDNALGARVAALFRYAL